MKNQPIWIQVNLTLRDIAYIYSCPGHTGYDDYVNLDQCVAIVADYDKEIMEYAGFEDTFNESVDKSSKALCPKAIARDRLLIAVRRYVEQALDTNSWDRYCEVNFSKVDNEKYDWCFA